jgi:ABC-type multidrug transport system ATPase subunit
VKTLVGYVPQDDIVHEDLTVQENLVMAHALRSGFKDVKEGRNVVNEVCELPTWSPQRDVDPSPNDWRHEWLKDCCNAVNGQLGS